MPKITGKVLVSKIVDGVMLAKIQLNGRLIPAGTSVTIKWGKVRSREQNSLYWLYLQFLFDDCGLRDEYGTVDELHETFKATFLSKRVFHGGKEFIKVGSTTALGKIEFGEYLERIDKAMAEYHNINSQPFWDAYEAQKNPKVREVPKTEVPF